MKKWISLSLSGGNSSRFHFSDHKALHQIGGKAMAAFVIDAMQEGTGLEYDVLLSELIADEDFIGEGEIGIMLLTCFAEFGDGIEDFFEDEDSAEDRGEPEEGWTDEEELQFASGCAIVLSSGDVPELGALSFDEAVTVCECVFGKVKEDVTGSEFLYFMSDDEQVALGTIYAKECYTVTDTEDA